ncbi:hypothetical protein AUC43_09200 [Hymenobacter sedentarius]|uniref:Uncharacterized protein n=1 Tax=Hymenobacter sedentarius TaxID=1411621 RepID=A0A0U4CAM8_9BACT|nr:hypothetical protein [Hymenobacter sedentarius]ALW85257.1 hypothetical protein AUC43_09200 [Hymenobacter sedentarius]
MKYVGFLQQHDPCLVAEDLLALPGGSPSPGAEEELAVVTCHQQRAVLVFGWMHYVSDAQTGEIIAPHVYYTDGEWVWPSYLLHYLGTRNLGAHYAGFVAHAGSCRSVRVSKAAEAAIEEQLIRLFQPSIE